MDGLARRERLPGAREARVRGWEAFPGLFERRRELALRRRLVSPARRAAAVANNKPVREDAGARVRLGQVAREAGVCRLPAGRAQLPWQQAKREG